jgi:hypothetical protein
MNKEGIREFFCSYFVGWACQAGESLEIIRKVNADLQQNGSDSNSFPLEARKNKGTIFPNIAPLFSEPRVRASREKTTMNGSYSNSNS